MSLSGIFNLSFTAINSSFVTIPSALLNLADNTIKDKAKICWFCSIELEFLDLPPIETFPPRKDPNNAPKGPPKENPIIPPIKLPQIDILFL